MSVYKLNKTDIHKSQLSRLTSDILDRIFKCNVCGKCSAGCPVEEKWDFLPSEVIHYLQLGLFEDVKHCKTISVCAQCEKCAVSCPKKIDLVDLMKQIEEEVKHE